MIEATLCGLTVMNISSKHDDHNNSITEVKIYIHVEVNLAIDFDIYGINIVVKISR